MAQLEKMSLNLFKFAESFEIRLVKVYEQHNAGLVEYGQLVIFIACSRRSDSGGSNAKRRAKREERRGKKGEGVGESARIRTPGTGYHHLYSYVNFLKHL